jgi:DNA (cytosine-5)-methyltransferase 1
MAGYTDDSVGIEWDAAACRTAHAAGHTRVRADVATFPLAHLAGRVDGAILSPPCQAWSNAGDQKGKLDQGKVHERIAYFACGEQPPDREWADERSMLTAEPMRWAYTLRPRWIALEQVPPVLPLWQYTAEKLRELGYRTWCACCPRSSTAYRKSASVRSSSRAATDCPLVRQRQPIRPIARDMAP